MCADAVVFGSSARSRKTRNLERDPRVVVHLESGDEVVILEGEAQGIDLDEGIADAYGRKYDWRPSAEEGDSRWFRLRPAAAFGWLERDYPRTATRFLFDEA